jgi:hypothetical protein
MKKRFTFLFAMLVALVTTAMADNVISVDQTAISQSGTAKLTINLANTGVVRGLQFTLTLPDGVTAVSSNQGITYTDGGSQTYSPGETGVLVSKTDRTKNWWVLGNKVSDNVYKFVMIDPNGGGLDAGDGAIMTISFETTLTEPFTVDITGIHMAIEGSDGSSEDTTQSDIEDANVTVTDIIRGDVNGNGTVEIGDAVCLLRRLAEKPNAVFIEAAADVNNNNGIDIGDAVLILRYLAEQIDALSRGVVDDTDWDFYDPD